MRGGVCQKWSEALVLLVAVLIAPIDSQAQEIRDQHLSGSVLHGRVLGFATNPELRARWTRAQSALATDDRLALQFFLDGERGGARQTLHDLRRGRAHLSMLPIASLATLVPELEVVLAPYLFASSDEARFVFDNYLFEVFDELLASRGLRLLVWQTLEWQGLAANAVLHSPSQVFGLQFGNALVRDDAAVPGAAQRTLFLSLGAIEADKRSVASNQLPPKSVLQTSATATDHQYSHFTQTRHLFAMAAVIVNSDWFAGATQDQRSLLRSAFEPADSSPGTPISIAAGPVVHELSAADLHIWRRATAQVLPRLVKQVGGQSIAVLGALERGKAAFVSQ